MKRNSIALCLMSTTSTAIRDVCTFPSPSCHCTFLFFIQPLLSSASVFLSDSRLVLLHIWFCTMTQKTLNNELPDKVPISSLYSRTQWFHCLTHWAVSAVAFTKPWALTRFWVSRSTEKMTNPHVPWRKLLKTQRTSLSVGYFGLRVWSQAVFCFVWPASFDCSVISCPSLPLIDSYFTLKRPKPTGSQCPLCDRVNNILCFPF